MRAIDADTLEKDIRENYEKYADSVVFEEQVFAIRFKQIEQYIKTFPVVEVEPVKRGKWIESNENGFENVYCSACGCSTYRDECFCDYVRFAYCPSCGAKMEGD